MRPQLGAGMLQSVDAADYAEEVDVRLPIVYAEATRTGTYSAVDTRVTHEIDARPTISHEVT